jgi:LDH2 family malate/lactate/ureidoglycolate dehydrogenase
MNADWTTMARWSRELLTASGLDEAAADAVVDTLLYAERRGFASHGFMRLPTYAARVQSGGIKGHAHVTVLSDQPALAIVDADAAAGAASAITCVELALRKARESGAAVVVARNANHFGSAGFYTDMMAAAGFLGIAVCNTDPWMCAPFGGRPVLGTNPISIGVPLTGGIGPQLDMATSEGNYGKIAWARDHGEPIPTGWAVDVDGAPTNDAAQAIAGALLPSGGPKGFGLAFMVDCLLAISGARTSDHAGPLYGDPADPQELGHAFIAIAVDPVQTPSDYAERIASLTAAVHDSATPGSSRPPMVPGEPERQRLEAASDCVVSDTTLRAFEALSRELAVSIPDTY